MEDLGGAQKTFCASHFVLALVGPLLSFLPLILIFEESHLEGFVFTALIVSALSACFLLERRGLMLSTLMLSFAIYLSDLQTLGLPCLWAAFSISFMVSTYSWQELKGIFVHFIEDEKALCAQSLYAKRLQRPQFSMPLEHHRESLQQKGFDKSAEKSSVALENSYHENSSEPSIKNLQDSKSVHDPKVISLQKLLALTQHQLKKEGEKNKDCERKITLLEKHFEDQNHQVNHLSEALKEKAIKEEVLSNPKQSQLRAQFEEKKEEIKALRKELFEKQLSLDTAKKKAQEKELETPSYILEKKLKLTLEELSRCESQEKRLLELVTHWSQA